MSEETALRALLSVQFLHGKVLSINNINCFQTRGESTAKMILDAVNLFPATEGIKDQHIYVHTSDHPREDIGPHGELLPNHFYYSCDKPEDLNHVFPDFAFDAWPQVGIASYMDTVTQILANAQKPYTSNKLFWIGAITHSSRINFLNIAQTRPDLIEAIYTNVDRHFIEDAPPVRYVSLPEHTNYKYLIDIEGVGWSARLKYLLFTHRVLFIQERRWKQYYLYELEPYKHFIPVRNDLADLIQQIELVEKEGENFYKYIVNNALNYAVNNLQYIHAIKRIRQLISNQSINETFNKTNRTL